MTETNIFNIFPLQSSKTTIPSPTVVSVASSSLWRTEKFKRIHFVSDRRRLVVVVREHEVENESEGMMEKELCVVD